MWYDPIKEMNEYVEKYLSIHSFSFYGPKKILESNIFKLFLKIKVADLRKIGLQMREWHFRDLAPKFPCEGRVMSLTSLPPPASHFP